MRNPKNVHSKKLINATHAYILIAEKKYISIEPPMLTHELTSDHRLFYTFEA